MEPLNPLQPQFSVAEFSHLAGLDRGLVDLRIHRGLIKPTKVDRLTIRQRASFSIAAVFEQKVIKVLEGDLGIGVADAGGAAGAITGIDDGKWMHHAARYAERERPMNLAATVHRSKACWQACLQVGLKNFRNDFGDEAAWIFLPIGTLFFVVYSKCKAFSVGLPTKPGGKK